MSSASHILARSSGFQPLKKKRINRNTVILPNRRFATDKENSSGCKSGTTFCFHKKRKFLKGCVHQVECFGDLDLAII